MVQIEHSFTQKEDKSCSQVIELLNTVVLKFTWRRHLVEKEDN